MKAHNSQWIGFSMEIGPAGNLYVLDWHDANITGSEVVHKETGRIYRMAPEISQAKSFDNRYADLNTLSDLQLADLQTSESDWHSRRARVILQSRAAKSGLSSSAIARLKEIYLKDQNIDLRLRAMWALHITNNFNENELLSALDNEEQYIRGWAIQFLCEDKSPSDAALSRFTEMAGSDTSPVVRGYLAAALLRMDHDSRWDIAANLCQWAEDSGDNNIPKMLWFGVEPLIAENPERALELASKSRLTPISEFIARRAVDADEIELVVEWIGKVDAAKATLLKGLYDGMEGRSDLQAPANWASVYEALQADPTVSEMATAVAQRFGDVAASAKFLAMVQDDSAPIEQRRTAIRNLAALQVPELVPLIPSLVDNPDLRIEGLRAIAAYDNWELGQEIIQKYDSFNAVEKLEFVQAYASRQNYGWVISGALHEGKIPKSDIPPYVARQFRRVVGNGFLEVYGPIEQPAGGKVLQFAKYEALLTEAALNEADPVNGQKVFAAHCGACHKMYSEGGTIGPDITGSNRANLDYLLSNIIDPSGEVQDDYKLVVVSTRDGRTYAGNIVGENDRQIRMRMVGLEDAIVINKSNIQTQEVTANSLMPEGLLSSLSEQQVLDLVAFLRTIAPPELGQSH